MKRLLGLLAIVVLTFSCTKDDNNAADASAVQKTAVAFNVAQAPSTARTIDRGNIPYYVENLTIKAISTAIPLPFVASETFDFTGVLNALAPALTLDNVALGDNTFSATSTSAAANKRLSLVRTSATDLVIQKAHVPYIVTASTNNPLRTIIAGTNAPIPLIMGTNNGRVLALFGVAAPEADNYTISVRYQINSGAWSSPVAVVTPTTSGRHIAFEWSNEDAVDGAVVNFEILISEAGINKPVLKTITKSITVQKAKSISCEYTVTNLDVHENIENGGITITFPTIEEAPCPLDVEGYDCNGRDREGYNRQGFNRCGWHRGPNSFYNANQDENPGNGGANDCAN
jgi:hypothetical protein